ncbi:MAG: methylated-DNA--[protein]-cysteine S-methyltransferase [Myxococcales bacterium]|nr:methylated-DNA--[protein]-cysteine S-methyltransferase [Myxococcales bacterium]MCB9708843.1 methylated-DNA--[protein]-cysteine S-methyltransferase [Myxococcales bacterium]
MAWSKNGLVAVSFQRFDASDAWAKAAQMKVPDEFARPLMHYFAGEPVNPALLRVDLQGSDFQKRVWTALRHIPRGSVRSYAGIAADIGSPRAVRAVGGANAANPVAVVVPCHRVVESGFRLGGYSGGLAIKRHLLRLEGIESRDNRVYPGQLELAGG